MLKFYFCYYCLFLIIWFIFILYFKCDKELGNSPEQEINLWNSDSILQLMTYERKEIHILTMLMWHKHIIKQKSKLTSIKHNMYYWGLFVHLRLFTIFSEIKYEKEFKGSAIKQYLKF